MLRIPYPWVHGETHFVKLLTSTGLAFEHEIAVAVPTPRPGARFFGLFALIGLYVGVHPGGARPALVPAHRAASGRAPSTSSSP